MSMKKRKTYYRLGVELYEDPDLRNNGAGWRVQARFARLFCDRPTAPPDRLLPRDIVTEIVGIQPDACVLNERVYETSAITSKVLSLPGYAEPAEFFEVDSQWEHCQRRRDWELVTDADARSLGYSSDGFQDSVESKVARQCARAAERGLACDLTPKQWRKIVSLFRGECVYCGVPCARPIMDHVVPIFSGGGTTANNVAPSCWRCNMDKSRMPPEVFFALYPERCEEFSRRLADAIHEAEEPPGG